MMTDRELLEKAAKAAGVPWHKGGPSPLGYAGWDPLTDDGDALRLAAKLRINVEYTTTMGGIDAGVNCWPRGRGDCGLTVLGDDAAKSTRRAIVMAAAALDA